MSDRNRNDDRWAMREILDEVLETERNGHRMVNLQLSTIAVPAFCQIITMGLRCFQNGRRDAAQLHAIDTMFAEMERAIGEGKEPTAKLEPQEEAFLQMTPEERDEARRAHKAMTLFALVEVSLMSAEAKTEMARVMAELGTTSSMCMPPEMVHNIDEYCAEHYNYEEIDCVQVMLMGPPDKVAEFAKEHNLGHHTGEVEFGDDDTPIDKLREQGFHEQDLDDGSPF